MSEPTITTDDLIELSDAPAGPKRRSFEYHAICLVISIVVLVLAMTMSISGGTKVLPPLFSQPLPELCHSRRFFGIDCPGCGLTRCFISLGHGDLRAAWQYNAAGIVLFGLFIAQIPFRSLQMWRLTHGQDEWRPRRFMYWLSVVIVIMLLVQWFWKLYQMALMTGG